MSKLWAVIMAAIMALACPSAMAGAEDISTRANEILEQLNDANYDDVAAQFDANMAAALNADSLGAGWESLAAQYGAFTGVDSAQAYEDKNAVVMQLKYEKGMAKFTLVFDAEGKISGMNIAPAQAAATPEFIEKALPEGAEERAVKLFAGTDIELNGVLTLPAGADENTPCALLVHGSGPSDMDETVGAAKPFRDLASDLAQGGVASLRFDKITYAHSDHAIETVEQEYLEPVKEAVRVLREECGMQKIYLTGHSEGGILTPWLVRECELDGGIALAGTPYSLWMASYAQNLEMIELMPEDQRAESLATVDAEKAKGDALATMTEDEAAAQTVFGMGGKYLRSIDILDEAAIAAETGKPYMFIRGEADVQVTEELFAGWQEKLGEGENYTYKTYPGLSHLFTRSEDGDNISNIMQAYSRPALMDASVGADIAAWILAQ